MATNADDKLYSMGFIKPKAPTARGVLMGRFIVPPMSVLNTRERSWQGRKKRWRELGIEGELGRDGALLNFPETIANPDFYVQKRKLEKRDRRTYKTAEARKLLIELGWIVQTLGDVNITSDKSTTGKYVHTTSLFDPVLCELIYTWFCPPDGQVVDPFAGGCVRGVVAAVLGRQYWGCDLRAEQVVANDDLADKIVPENKPTWVVGDSRERLADAPAADLVFSCPPYGHLEKYSDDPADISGMSVGDFREAYQEIIIKAADRLRPDRFACFVVADYRDKDGFYCNLPGGTITSFRRAGLRLYNEVILMTSVSTVAVRMGRQFPPGRKLGKVHQNVLVFVKGDPKKAAARCPLED